MVGKGLTFFVLVLVVEVSQVLLLVFSPHCSLEAHVPEEYHSE